VIEVIDGDCREVMAKMPEASIDCCITDPPYGDTNLSWDSKQDGWLAPLARVLKPNAGVWIFGSLRFIAPMFEQLLQLGFNYSQDIVWEKQNGTGFLNDRFRRVHEHAVLFYRGKWSEIYKRPQTTLNMKARVVKKQSTPHHWHGATKGMKNGTASNRDLLSDGSVLSDVSSTVASRILDWTGNTGSTA